MSKTTTPPSVSYRNPHRPLSRLRGWLGLLAFLYTGWLYPSQAQTPAASAVTRVISGTVTDAEKSPLVGVTIVAKTSKKSTITDAKGEFSLRVTDQDRILVFSFIGMEPQEVDIQKTSTLTIALKQSSQELGEVVVNGYYKTDKNTFTGAATTVTAKDIQNISQTNLFSVLQAVDPSFRVIENNLAGGDPNRTLDIQLRGGSSLNTSVRNEFTGNPNMPTFIVNGFEQSAQKVFDLDPTRIESITILKDASATAMYGSRAANGVVVIELKPPQSGKLNVQYNLQSVLNVPDLTSYHLLNGQQKVDVEIAGGIIQPLTEAYNLRVKNIAQGYDTYWLNKPIQRGVSLSHSLILDGGNDHFTYAVNLNINPSKGVMKGSNRNRYAIGAQMGYRTRKLTVNNFMNFDYVVGNGSPYGSFSIYTRMNPYYRYYDNEGNYLYTLGTYRDNANREINVFNPLWNSTLKFVDQNRYQLFTDNINVLWNILPTLRLNTGVGVNIQSTVDENYLSPKHTSFGVSENLSQRGSYQVMNSRSIQWEGRTTLTYNATIRTNHAISTNVGLRYSDNNTIGNGFKAIGFPSDELSDPSFASGYAPNSRPTGNSRLVRDGSFFSNLNYSFANAYFVDAVYSRDISSLFGKLSRISNNFSAGIGYNLHKNPLIQKLKYISTFRLRANYGQVGGQGFDAIQALYIYNFNTNTYYDGNSVGATLNRLGNENLEWQKVFNTNLGADIGLFNDRITGRVDYYRKVTKDAVTPITLAPSTGFATYTDNLGDILNHGLELTLRVKVINTPNVKWTVSGNGAYNKNKILKISNAIKEYNSQGDKSLDSLSNRTAEDGYTPTYRNAPRVRFIEGQSQNTIWVVQSLGIDPSNGKELFLDQNGEKTYLWSSANLIPYGITDPTLEGTLQFNFSYKNITLNSALRYAFGGLQYNQTLVNRVENADLDFNVDERVFSQRWRKAGDQVLFKDIADKTNTLPTSRFVEKNNFIEMTSLNVSYDFPNRITSRLLHMKLLRCTFYMNDLFRASTIQIERGLDYPFQRTFNFAIRTTF